jgi:hypothetical protein
MLIHPLKLVQRRIANISIVPSTLRGQSKGTIKTTRSFFESFDPNVFEDIFKNEIKKVREGLEEQYELGVLVGLRIIRSLKEEVRT